jgi:prolyl-tRNA editing enzyme YbaK/EbsC (Cys-tRNA(Pro) deacylase)
MSSVDRVRQALEAHGLEVQVQELPQSTRTAQLAAQALGCELGAIVKSLLFLADDRPVLVLVSGDRRADPMRLRLLLGAGQVGLAGADRVRAETGFAIGGVPPVGHRQPIPVVVDRELSRFARLWAAAGTPNAVFPITFAQLVAVTGGQEADISLAEAAA